MRAPQASSLLAGRCVCLSTLTFVAAAGSTKPFCCFPEALHTWELLNRRTILPQLCTTEVELQRQVTTPEAFCSMFRTGVANLSQCCSRYKGFTLGKSLQGDPLIVLQILVLLFYTISS